MPESPSWRRPRPRPPRFCSSLSRVVSRPDGDRGGLRLVRGLFRVHVRMPPSQPGRRGGAGCLELSCRTVDLLDHHSTPGGGGRLALGSAGTRARGPARATAPSVRAITCLACELPIQPCEALAVRHRFTLAKPNPTRRSASRGRRAGSTGSRASMTSATAAGAWTFAPAGASGGSPRPTPNPAAVPAFSMGLSAGNQTVSNVAAPTVGQRRRKQELRGRRRSPRASPSLSAASPSRP